MGAYHKPVTNKVLDQAEQAIDEEFGNWIRLQRQIRRLTVGNVRDATRIPLDRIVEIESGKGKGITKREILALHELYLLDLTAMLARAEGRII